jgi:acetyl/propionyl-CoA carboxylase alpha subunit
MPQKTRIPRKLFIWGSNKIDAQIIICSAGRPSTPLLIKASVGGDGKSLDVEWNIVSYSPILEYNVHYKNTKASSFVVIVPFLIIDSYVIA